MRHTLRGGTVDFVALGHSLAFSKRKSLASRLEAGTLPFQEIISLKHGFHYISNVFGTWKCLYNHTMALCMYARQEIESLTYGSSSLCSFYPKQVIWEIQGPIIAFNLLQPDGQFLGYSQVVKLASVHKIHLRAGCFCNPGACEQFLGLNSEDVKRNYKVTRLYDRYMAIRAEIIKTFLMGNRLVL